MRELNEIGINDGQLRFPGGAFILKQKQCSRVKMVEVAKNLYLSIISIYNYISIILIYLL